MSAARDDFSSRLRANLLSMGVGPVVLEGAQLATEQVLSSLLILEIILLVEAELGRELTEAELTNENFDTLDAVCRLAHPLVTVL